jgi:hypothetical protein
MGIYHTALAGGWSIVERLLLYHLALLVVLANGERVSRAKVEAALVAEGEDDALHLLADWATHVDNFLAHATASSVVLLPADAPPSRRAYFWSELDKKSLLCAAYSPHSPWFSRTHLFIVCVAPSPLVSVEGTRASSSSSRPLT